MKRVAWCFVVAVAGVAGCKDDAETSSSSSPSSNSEAPRPASTGEAGKGASTTAPPPPNPEPAPAPPPKKVHKQKGVEKGQAILGYMQDLSDEGACAAITDKETKKLTDKDKADLAKALKGKWVESCPLDNVVLTCKAPFGVIVNYSSPKYTVDTAKKQCAKSQGKVVP